MNYNDYGHLRSGRERGGVGLPDRTEIGHHVPFRRDSSCPAADSTRSAAWPGPVAAPFKQGGGVHRRRQHWKDAEIQGTAYRMAHTRFSYQWNWDGKETELLSRCTDELGQVQPSRAQVAKFWNVPLDPSYSVPGLDNTIQPWRIASDGSVHQWACLGFSDRVLACSWGVSALAQVAHVWSGTHAERRGNPRVGYLHRSYRSGTPAGARHGQGRRAALSRRRGARDATGRRGSRARRPI